MSFPLLLAVLFCLDSRSLGAVTVPPLSAAEYWAEWEAHVSRFHNADPTFLASTERFKAFSKVLDFVRKQNARYAAGESTWTAALNPRAAYLPHERLHGHFQPEAVPSASSLQAAARHRMMLQRKTSVGGGCGPGQKPCPAGKCCSKQGYCGTGSAFCSAGCQKGFGVCWSPPPPPTKPPPRPAPKKPPPLRIASPPPKKWPPPSGPKLKHATGAALPSLNYVGAVQAFVDTRFKAESIAVKPARSVDWTQVPNVVNPIENQGACGSCWAFAATAAIESINGITSGVLPLLSEQELLDCSSGAAGGPGYGCEGGWADEALNWVVQNGQATLNSYPYSATDQQCQGSGVLGAGITGYGYVPPQSDTALMQVVSAQPVVITIAASSYAFQYYSGGILNDADGCGTDLDHNVVVVGYGYDSASGLNYYKLRNSWDVWWGEDGYMRVAMLGDGSMGMCGMLLALPVYPNQNSARNPCGASPCGGGSCQNSPGRTGGYICTRCPSGYTVQNNPDGSETCAGNPCRSGNNPCGAGTCTNSSSANYGYTCSCSPGTVNGQNSDGSPTCVGGGTGGQIHVVKPGDTCKSIAQLYQDNPIYFQNVLNPGINCYNLHVGQVVNIGTTASYTSPGCTQWHDVQSGDTCYGIQQQFGIDIATFQALNPSIDCYLDKLYVGEPVCVAGNETSISSVKKCGKTYEVQAGDTCTSIAKKFQLSAATFNAINAGINCAKLKVGDQICSMAATAISAPRCSKSWFVQRGNTCFSIWSNFGLNQTMFMNLNPGLICSELKVGNKVCVASV